MFPVTAKSSQSLKSALAHLRKWVMTQDKSDLCITRVAYTLTLRRSLMPWRHTFVASKKEDILAALVPESLRATRTANVNRIIFVFTGQGAQWPTMGRELISSSPQFKKSLLHSSAILSRLGAPWDLLDELLSEEATSRLYESEIGQPTTTALQIGLVELLRSLGVAPNVVLGHSSGEIAAAYAAGAISKESAIEISYHRSFLAKRCKGILNIDGAMLSVGIGEEEVCSYISQLTAGRVVVACCNSPLSTTVSGDEDAILSLKRSLEQSATPVRRLRVDTAYHSHHMEAVAEDYLHSVGGLQPKEADMTINFYSTVTAQEKTSGFGPAYWVSNLVSKVRFFEGLKHLCQRIYADSMSPQASSCHTFVEIGPNNTLLGPIKQTLTHLKMGNLRVNCISTLRRQRNSHLSFLQAVGNIFECGVPIDLARTNSFEDMSAKPMVVSDMAPYPWDHSVSYWQESRLSREHRLRPHPYHDILGLRCIGDTISEPSWRHVFSIESLPWLRDHAVDDRLVFPAAAYIAMAIEAKKQISLDRLPTCAIRNYILRGVVFSKILEIPNSPQCIEVVLTLRHSVDRPNWDALSSEEFRVCSISLEGVTYEHCRGHIMAEAESGPDHMEVLSHHDAENAGMLSELHLKSVEKTPFTAIDPKRMYEEWQAQGHYWGPSFSLITEMDVKEFEASGTATIGHIANIMPGCLMQPHIIHPTTLDALIHSSLIVYGRTCGSSMMFPIGIDELIISANLSNAPGETLMFQTSIKPHNLFSTAMQVVAFQERLGIGPQLCVQIKGGQVQGTKDSKASSARSYATRDLCYRIDWNLDPDLCQPLRTQTQDNIASGMSLTYGNKMGSLERATSSFISLCLDKVARTDIHERYLRYYDWMERCRTSEQFQGVEHRATQTEIQEEFHHNPTAGAEEEALFRIGSHLGSILIGDSDPLSLLLEGGLLARLYAEDAAAQRCRTHATDYIQHLIFKNPRMKFLEIGAGTAGLTLPLLQRLSCQGKFPSQSYDFTDVSSGFFEEAKQKLREWDSLIRYKTLDIGKNPDQQGFESGSYDLVLAYNALHVTASIDDALANARQLLKPGGRLILIEITQLVPYVNMIFGLLPGWYMGESAPYSLHLVKKTLKPLTCSTERNDGRNEAPVISTDQWNGRLLQKRFNGIDFKAHDYDSNTGTMTMMVSKAISTERSSHALKGVQIFIDAHIMVDDYSLTQRIVQLFIANSTETFVRRLPLEGPPNQTVDVIVDDDTHPLMTEYSAEKAWDVVGLLAQATKVLWITGMDSSSAVLSQGCDTTADIARAARAGNDTLNLVTLSIQQRLDISPADIDRTIFEILQNCFFAPTIICETDYYYKNGLTFVPRLRTEDKLKEWIQGMADQPIRSDLFHDKDRCLRLHDATTSKAHSLYFVDSPDFCRPIETCEIEIQCEAFGVNLEQALAALDEMKGSSKIMGECAGIVTEIGSQVKGRYEIGDRVCGWGKILYASRNRVRGTNTHHLPSTFSFAEGASIPLAFITAYYALVKLANVAKNHTVLIHTAADNIGQAAIQIAGYIGVTILVTVRNASERKLLQNLFKIPEDYIFSASSKILSIEIERVTEGRGVDIVLGSSTGEGLRNAWACLARFGKFVDIGTSHKGAMTFNGMDCFQEGRAYFSADLAALSEYRPEETCDIMSQVMSMFKHGTLQPIQPSQTFQLTDVHEAFQTVQNKDHVGKLVLEATSNTMVKCRSRPGPPMKLSPDGTYVIAGDFGDLGLDLCRFMVSRGAKHIALIPWGLMESEYQRTLGTALRQLGSCMHTLLPNNSKQELTDEMISRNLRNMPPVRGVVQADMTLQVRSKSSSTSLRADALQNDELDRLSPEEFAFTLRSKSQGTRMLVEALKVSQIDFFLLLSSSSKILRSKRHRIYAATNAIQAAKSMGQEEYQAKCVALDLGGMKNSSLVAQGFQSEKPLFTEGLVPMTNLEMDVILEYALTRKASVNHIITGFDRRSLIVSDNAAVLKIPLFSHLSRAEIENERQSHVPSSRIPDQTIASAKSRQEAQQIVISALQQKISTLVTIEPQMIDLSIPMEDFGLDSLVMWGMRNWIFGNFRADIEPTQISAAASISSLASVVLDRSKYTVSKEQTRNETDTKLGKKNRVVPDFPQQPLPSLEDTLQAYLDAAHAFCSEEEFERTSQAAATFKEAGQFGQELQSRLAQREKDVGVENWLWDGLYTQRRFLRARTPVIACSSYFGTHPFSRVLQTQAERATVVSLAAFEFKRDLESGKFERHQSSLSGQVVDPECYQLLFNTCREPHVGEDQIVKYPQADYIVVLRYGHAFRVNLTENASVLTFRRLKDKFEAIIASTPHEMSWVGVLTADQRDTWAKVLTVKNAIAGTRDADSTKSRKDLLELSEDNKISIDMIQAAAFVVCLDAAEPKNSVERCNQFLYGAVANRWYDKTLQLVVCENGVSASVCEHSALDGISVEPLHDYMNRAIHEFDPQTSKGEDAQNDAASRSTELVLSTSKAVDEAIDRFKHEITHRISKFTFASLDVSSLGVDVLRSLKCPSQSGVQLAIQLACRRFFGYNPPAVETVSMAHFRKGRVEVHHIISPATTRFLEAVNEAAAFPKNLQRLFLDAVKAHAKSLSRVSKGKGFSRHLLALEWMLREGEEKPGLFEDPVYVRMKPGKVLTSNFTTGWLEGGFAYPVPESILVYFEIRDERYRLQLRPGEKECSPDAVFHSPYSETVWMPVISESILRPQQTSVETS